MAGVNKGAFLSQVGELSPRTFAVWLKKSDDENQHIITTTQGPANVAGDSMGIIYSGGVGYGYSFHGHANDFSTGYSNVGEWEHHVVTRGVSHVSYYINGEAIRTKAMEISLYQNADLHIGASPLDDYDSGDLHFTGMIDDFRIYNRPLSAAEVAQLYNYEPQPQPSSKTGKASAMVQVVNGFIVGAEIIDGGYGYTSNPEVTINGEGGFGAIATATVSAGQVIKINIQNPGFGYTGNPTIDIAAPPVPPASAYATGEVVNGFLVGATLVTGGEGYNKAPQVTVTGGGGSGAVAVAQVEDGRVVAVNIINPGNGYTSTPVITIAAPPSAPELSIRVTQVEVNMKLTVGKRYTIEASKNMVDWVQAGDLFTAEEQFKAMKFDVDDFGQFYRVIEQP